MFIGTANMLIIRPIDILIILTINDNHRHRVNIIAAADATIGKLYGYSLMIAHPAVAVAVFLFEQNCWDDKQYYTIIKIWK